MKKAITMLIITLLLGYFFLIKRTVINAGEEAVIIKKPWFWGEKGTEKKSIDSGTIWSVASTEVKKISLKAFTIEESFTELFTKDNIPLELALTLTFKNKKGEAILLVERFGETQEWYKNLLFKPLENSLESAIKKRTFEEITKESNTLKGVKGDILFGVKNFLQQQSVPVELLEITFGTIIPPQAIVQSAIKVKIEEANLKAKKLKIKEAEANAQADRAYMLKMNMSPREYLKIRKIELENQKLSLQRLAIEKVKDSNGSIKIEIKMEGL